MQIDVNPVENAFWDKKALEFDEKKIDDETKRLAELIAADLSGSVSVLDMATGSGNVALRLANDAAVVEAFDLSHEMVSLARRRAAERKLENVKFSRMNAYHADYPDESFDAVVICNSLQFMEFPEKALVEARRVLKTGGLLAIPTACFGDTPELRLKAEGMIRSGFPAHHLFTSRDLVEITQKSGFRLAKQEAFSKYCTHFKNMIPFAYIIARSA